MDSFGTPHPVEVDPVEVDETPSRPTRTKSPRWLIWALVIVGGLLVLTLAASRVRLPYYALSPGPVEEVDDITSIEQAPTYQLHGDLYMLTVSLQEVNPFEFLQGWFDPNVDLYETERIRPPDVTPEERREHNRQLNADAREVAVAVALRHLDYPVEESGEGILVAEVVPDSPADGVLQVDDVIVQVDGKAVLVSQEGINAITSHQVGDEITLTFMRAGEQMQASLRLAEHDDQPGRPLVGFVPQTVNPFFVLPFSVTIDTTNIGGPSAGMMYALTVLDLLTEQDLIKGNVVAGTGTIDLAGNVGPIGGVRQKVVAAQEAGAQYILVPQENFADAITVKSQEVEIFAVSSLEDALQVLEDLPAA